MRIVFNILLLLSLVSSFAQEKARIEDFRLDTTKAKENTIPLYRLDRYTKGNISTFYDTSLNEAYLMNPIYSHAIIPYHFSFYGSPMLDLEIEPRIGLIMERGVYDPYRITKNDFILNEARVPYMSANFQFSIPRGQVFDLKHTHAMNDFLTLGFNYQRVGSLESEFSSQRSNTKNFGLYAHFRSKNRRYNATASYITNNLYSQESGGIQYVFKNDTIDWGAPGIGEKGEEVANIIQGANSIQSRLINFQHSYVFGYDTLEAVNDSVYNRNFIERFRIFQDAGIETYGYYYSDEGMLLYRYDTSYAYPTTGAYVNLAEQNNGERYTGATRDSSGLLKFYNEIGFQFYKIKKYTKDSVNKERGISYIDKKTEGRYYKYFIGASIKHELNDVSTYYSNLFHGYYTNTIGLFRGFYSLNKEHRFIGDYEHYISGFNQNNRMYTSRFQSKLWGGRIKQELGCRKIVASPYLNYSVFVSNHMNWRNSLQHVKTNELFYRIAYFPSKSSVSIKSRTIDNFTFMTDTFEVQQVDGVNELQLGFTQAVDWKLFHLRVNGLYRGINDTLSYRRPKLELFTSLYLQTKFIKGTMLFQAGIEGRYFSQYYADHYLPNFRDGVQQNNVLIGNYPVLNAFVNVKVEMARVFIRVHHINQYARDNYFLVPGYPMAALTPFIEAGIRWKFLY